jgi:hypothetical protein
MFGLIRFDGFRVDFSHRTWPELNGAGVKCKDFLNGYNRDDAVSKSAKKPLAAA